LVTSVILAASFFSISSVAFQIGDRFFTHFAIRSLEVRAQSAALL
jgi:hypothetical protein